MTVGVYCRISDDTEGVGAGVSRQEHDCRKLAELRGWVVAGLYVDNDFSAFKTNVVRPEFEHLLSDLGTGIIDGIVAYDLDRFARQPVDLERAIRLFDARPLTFATVQGDLDLSSGDGRTMARVLIAFANKSSMDTSRRVKRKHLELAMQGEPVGGYRPFGYELDKRTVNHAEAILIREAVRDVLAGGSLNIIVRKWNALGVKTSAGNSFKPARLKRTLLSPRIAGYRVYHGKIAIGEDGLPVKGKYDPIIDVDTWEQVCAVLTDPSRTSIHVHMGGRKYLLSGIIRCANCSGLLSGNANKRWDTFSYACRSAVSGGCGKVSISGTKVDTMITELVLAYLSEQEVQIEAEPWSRETELAEVRNRVQELMNAFAGGTISAEVVFPTVSKLENQLNQLRDERTVWLRQQASLTNRPTNVSESWPEMSTDQRREVVSSVIQAVVVKPATSQGLPFKPDRVSVVWK